MDEDTPFYRVQGVSGHTLIISGRVQANSKREAIQKVAKCLKPYHLPKRVKVEDVEWYVRKVKAPWDVPSD